MVTDPRDPAAQPQPSAASRPGSDPSGGPGYNPIRWGRFWLIFGVLLLANIVISRDHPGGERSLPR